MPRTSVWLLSALVSVSAVMVFGIAFGGRGNAMAQGDESTDHPVVGSWLVESDPGDAEYSLRLLMLSADGSAMFVSGRAVTGVGGWEATGDTTATLTFTVVSDGPAYIVIRASVDLAADGQSFTGTFTNEIVFDPARGGTSGEIGPGSLTGQRLAVEAPGTPVESFEDFFPSAGGTPEATPAT